MFQHSLKRPVTFLRHFHSDILFFSLSVISVYYNFYLFFQTVERPIATEIHSCLFLHLTAALALCLPYFAVKRRKAIVLVLLTALNCYLVCNLLYYRTYFTLLPFDSYTMIGNLGDLYDSITSAFHRGDILFFVPTLILSALYFGYFRRRTVALRPMIRVACACVGGLIVAITIGLNLYWERNEISNLLSDENEFKYDVIDGASTYGFLHCWFWQFRAAVNSNEKLTEEERTKIAHRLTKQQQQQIFASKDSLAGKNLIVLIVESLESFPIGQKTGKTALTPCLNKLIAEEKCLYAPHMIPQVNIGHSSDTQLIFNTGLLPPHTGAACFKYARNEYPSLPKALKSRGYTSHTLLGGNGSFWNQGVMNKTYGYDELISIEQFNEDESYDFGLTDSTFLAQASDKIKGFKSPFLAQLVTLSSHDPYVLINHRSYLKMPADCPEELGRYLNAVHYVDKCIGMFVDKLKANDLWKNSVVVISGDHQATKQKPREWEKYIGKQWKASMNRTPFIVLNGPATQYYKSEVGQIDVYPTLIDLFGLKEYHWHGLGYSMFDPMKPHVAINARYEAFGDFGNTPAGKLAEVKQAWETSDLMIRKNYFAKP